MSSPKSWWVRLKLWLYGVESDTVQEQRYLRSHTAKAQIVGSRDRSLHGKARIKARRQR